ncbi:MAG TPA: hypothetical protein VK190_03005 [Pseudoneobacillus sp.]|nr:hypothetical protein [Pseudoneobacillus sp.]
MRYKYDFGIKDLIVQQIKYEDKAAFISKPYSVDGNVSQVSLKAIEEHPVLDISGNIPVSDRCTSVEYYVTNVINPSASDWKPILPDDQASVRNELLFFDNQRTALLRFKALPTNAVVYRNGQKISEHDWTFSHGCTTITITNNFLATCQYTIDYTPDGNPYDIDFDDNIEKQYEETFDGTDRNMTISLKHYPYINYEKINSIPDYDPNASLYRPIEVTLKDTDIMGPGRAIYAEIGPDVVAGKPYTSNKTDYLSNTDPELAQYEPNTKPVFEYKQDKNKLYFTETFNKADIRENMALNHGNAKVHVKYSYTSSSIRIKIILRKTSHVTNDPITPVVKEFSLRMKMI